MTKATELPRLTTEAELGPYYINVLTPLVTNYATDDIDVLSQYIHDFHRALKNSATIATSISPALVPQDYMERLVALLGAAEGQNVINIAASLLTYREEKIDYEGKLTTPNDSAQSYGWTELDWINFVASAVNHDLRIVENNKRDMLIYGYRDVKKMTRLNQRIDDELHELQHKIDTQVLLQLDSNRQHIVSIPTLHVVR